MRILIIDDDQLTSTTWAMGLKTAGYEVINATNGQIGATDFGVDEGSYANSRQYLFGLQVTF